MPYNIFLGLMYKRPSHQNKNHPVQAKRKQNRTKPKPTNPNTQFHLKACSGENHVLH
jgi:hypothetical protein